VVFDGDRSNAWAAIPLSDLLEMVREQLTLAPHAFGPDGGNRVNPRTNQAWIELDLSQEIFEGWRAWAHERGDKVELDFRSVMVLENCPPTRRSTVHDLPQLATIVAADIAYGRDAYGREADIDEPAPKHRRLC
jgi:hypothetical protein